ncbi:MAG: family 78 glycoside hydrolase catalytic domain [Abitibacteriaceae bacterium]|nr:family 78 glycoside hydrolase catalytic domain [Abditibacteriaceae bacterium]
MKILFIGLALIMALVTDSWALGGMTATTLKCEYHINPLGIDATSPRLSWMLHSNQRNQEQTAYQILVASTPGRLSRNRGDLWNSGRVASDQSLEVVYAGKPLRSGQRVYWKVRVWDAHRKASTYSDPTWWEMGLLSPKDWQAQWISGPRLPPQSDAQLFDDHPAPLLRKEFVVAKRVASARAYVSGLGYYELHLNGAKVGDHVLDPGWTTYSKRVLYSTYDITPQLKMGRNAVGVMLGNGWYNPLPLKLWNHLNLREHLTIGQPRVILQIALHFTDGTTQLVASDETWKAGDGPILRNSVYLGEVYDARREQPGWDLPGFQDSHWQTAIIATESVGSLHAQDAPPIKVTRTLAAAKLTEPKPGIYIFDMGQNFAGWVRLRVRGAAGTRVSLRYGELLYPDGTLNGMTSVTGQIKAGGADYRYDGTGAPKTAFQNDVYILKGQGEESYTQHFTFHGFRYVEVTGLPYKPSLDDLQGLRLNAAVEPISTFSCSNEMFNHIQEMVLWTELSNLFSVQSDCPHREKFGYSGDVVASSEMAMLNFDMANFYAKTVHDLADAVRPNGGITETAPFVGIADQGLGEGAGPIGWGTAFPLLQWQLYQYYGNRRLLEEQYATTKQWIQLLQAKSKDNILDNGISDHESLVPKPRALTGTAFYYYNVHLCAHIAGVLGRTADAAHYTALAEAIKAAFNQRFLQTATGQYDTGTQACQSFAFFMDMVPAASKTAALDILVHDIEQNHNGHLSTGIFGTKYLLDTLTKTNRADLAYSIVNQKSFPGWGFMLANGATTLWEHWALSDNTYSHNHPMFGSVSEWFIKAIAGINPAPDAVGFNRIIIRPQVVGDLQWARGSYDSARGRISSEWKLQGNTLLLDVTIPPNTTAIVYVPTTQADSVTENDQPAALSKDVKLLHQTTEAAVYTVGSGHYHFIAPHEFNNSSSTQAF